MVEDQASLLQPIRTKYICGGSVLMCFCNGYNWRRTFYGGMTAKGKRKRII